MIKDVMTPLIYEILFLSKSHFSAVDAEEGRAVASRNEPSQGLPTAAATTAATVLHDVGQGYEQLAHTNF